MAVNMKRESRHPRESRVLLLHLPVSTVPSFAQRKGRKKSEECLDEGAPPMLPVVPAKGAAVIADLPSVVHSPEIICTLEGRVGGRIRGPRLLHGQI